MSYGNLSGISVAAGFALKSKQPIDARLVVPSLESLNPKWVYTGLVVYVDSTDETKGLYVYTGETDGWMPVAASGGTSSASFEVENDTLKILNSSTNNNNAQSGKCTIIYATDTSTGRICTSLENNGIEFRFATPLTELTITTPVLENGTEPTINDIAHYTVVFTAGGENIITDLRGIYFTGTNCNNGALVPVVDTTYELNIWWNGIMWLGSVIGVTA